MKTIKDILTAVQFLTRLPFLRFRCEEGRLSRSMRYFPLVGLLIGEILALANIFFERYFAANIVNALVIILLIALTGALHLDGFADTLDAFMSGKKKDEMLAIMKDSRIGVMGAVGLVVLLLLKYEALSSIIPVRKNIALLLMPVMGRWSMVLSAFSLPYARPEGGTGKVFTEGLKWTDLAVATASVVFIAGIFIRCDSFVFIFINLLIISILLLYARKKIGGVTGDVIGFVSEIVEVAVLLIFALGPKNL